MNTTESEHRPEHQSTRAASPRNLIIGAVVVALLIILGVYLWGIAQTRSQLEAQRTEYEQRISQMQTQMQGTKGELASARSRNQLLMARTDLYRAAAALDLRNFGIANTHLRQAEQALGRVDASSANLDAGKLKQLRSSIDSLNIHVATNLQDQRSQVLDLAAQLDSIALQDTEVGTARTP